MRLKIAAAILSLCFAGASVPASAVELPDAYPYPRMINPLVVPAVQIQGPDRLWGMRYFAAEVRGQINVRIDTRGYCNQRPSWVCVHVKIANFGRSGWCGKTTWRNSNRYIRIYLNTYSACTWPRRHAAAHEFAHALGLSHHERYGVVGEKGYAAIHLSNAELYVLRRYYGA